MHVNSHTHTHLHTQRCTHIHMHVHSSTCMYTHTKHIHMYTHTHTMSHLSDIQAPNPGNPVFTCDKHSSAHTPTLVTIPSEQRICELFHGNFTPLGLVDVHSLISRFYTSIVPPSFPDLPVNHVTCNTLYRKFQVGCPKTQP